MARAVELPPTPTPPPVFSAKPLIYQDQPFAALPLRQARAERLARARTLLSYSCFATPIKPLLISQQMVSTEHFFAAQQLMRRVTPHDVRPGSTWDDRASAGG
jgi:hypothetical protein